MKQVSNEEIRDLLMELGSLLPEGFVWSNKLKKKFERITSWLSSHLLLSCRMEIDLSALAKCFFRSLLT
jgi:hypothetical protein